MFLYCTPLKRARNKEVVLRKLHPHSKCHLPYVCLLYTSDAADDVSWV